MGGWSKARLARLDASLAAYVQRNDVAGIVSVVTRDGDRHVAAAGVQDLDTGRPMAADTVVRIASMSKVVLAAAALSLVEEGRIRLDESIERWMPELANRRVLRTPESPLDDTVPAGRPLSLRDLLTLRFGLGAIMAPPDTWPIQAAIAEAGLEVDFGSPDLTPDEWIARLAALPLVDQPGRRWMYHMGYDVLSVLLERLVGLPLEAFLAERIFAPLAMHDTGFSATAVNVERLASCYEGGDEPGGLHLTDPGREGSAARPPKFTSELVSTADNFTRFLQMLLDNGKVGDDRLLARPTIALMMSDQITDAQKAVSEFFPGFWENSGWGLGAGIVKRRYSIGANPGAFGWSGCFGTTYIVDPAERLTAVLMVQRHHDAVIGRLHTEFGTLVYQALDD